MRSRRFAGVRVGAQSLLAVHLQQEFHGRGEVAEAFIAGFTLAIGPRHFQAGGPIAAFRRQAAMERGSEFVHGPKMEPAGLK